MVDLECSHCHAALTLDRPDYTRVICVNCRNIVEVQRPLEAALPVAHRKALPARTSSRAVLTRPTGSVRHAVPRSLPREHKEPALKKILIPVAMGAAAMLVVCLGVFVLNGGKEAVQSSVAQASSAESADSKNSTPVAVAESKKSEPSKPDALLSARETEKLDKQTTLPRDANTPTVDGAKEQPHPPVKDRIAEEQALSAQPVTNPEPAVPSAQTAQAKNDLDTLLSAPVVRGKKDREDDEALVAAEEAARVAKAPAETAVAPLKGEDESRVKLSPDNPFAPKDEPAAKKEGAAMEPGAAKPGAPEVTKAKMPSLLELPVVCAGCMGSGYVPVMAPRKLVRGLKDPLPSAALLAPWKQCSKCKFGSDDKALAEAEAARMKDPQTLASQQNWSQMVQGKLDCIETRHVSVRSQLTAGQNKVVGDVLEQLTEHLQRTTKTTILTPTRPDTHELFLFSDRSAFETIRDTIGSNPNFDKAQLARISGVSMRNKGLYHLQPQQKPENMALFLFGRMTMTEATNGKGPFWLVEGFAAYCENTVMKKNLCYSITYEINDVKFSPNWDDDIRKYAAKRQLKPWKEIFPASGMLMKPLEYLTCYSMVSFLIKTDPQRFNKLVIAIREGHESPIALKMSYGRDVEELQRLWAMWALTAK